MSLQTPPALQTHAEQCDECRAAPLPLDGIGLLLSSMDVPLDSSALSARVMDRLLQEITIAAPTAWRRIVMALLKSLLPLPLVLAIDAYALRALYGLGNAFLPGALMEYVVVSYGAFLLLVFALTYAAVPLLLVRQGTRARAWGVLSQRSLA